MMTILRSMYWRYSVPGIVPSMSHGGFYLLLITTLWDISFISVLWIGKMRLVDGKKHATGKVNIQTETI